VVRLRQRQGSERDGKQPKIGLPAGARGSDKCLETPKFCGISADASGRIENVPTEETGGGRGTVVEPSLSLFQWVTNYTDCSGCCLENRGPLWRSRRGTGSAPRATRPSGPRAEKARAHSMCGAAEANRLQSYSRASRPSVVGERSSASGSVAREFMKHRHPPRTKPSANSKSRQDLWIDATPNTLACHARSRARP
jgi:hypothetical protein